MGPTDISSSLLIFFFFNDTATTEIYTLSLHDALPITISSAMPRSEVSGATKIRLNACSGGFSSRANSTMAESSVSSSASSGVMVNMTREGCGRGSSLSMGSLSRVRALHVEADLVRGQLMHRLCRRQPAAGDDGDAAGDGKQLIEVLGDNQDSGAGPRQ